MYEELKAMLHLERQIIGIRRFSASEMAQYHALDFQPVRHKAYYCWLVRRASQGFAYKSTFEEFACETAGWVLGLASADHFGSHEENVAGWMACGTFKTQRVAQQIYEGIEPLPRAAAIAIGPLEAFPEALRPDAVILIGKPYSMMRAVQGYSAHRGFAANLKMSGMCGICHESTAYPLQTDDLSLSMLCSGTRFYAKWGDDEMALSMPYPLLKTFADGVRLTLNPCEPDPRKVELLKRLKRPMDIRFQRTYYGRKQAT